MLEVLVGISFAFVVLEFADEWQQRRLSNRRLAAIRKQTSVLRRPWDTLRGRWIESPVEKPSEVDFKPTATSPHAESGPKPKAK
ncbi:MAG: hypothetical protein JWR49_2855 [Tardiphaga sp.]|jgi:hypothetical protein|nr:hypothetical protein [Tardiphaga sp.]